MCFSSDSPGASARSQTRTWSFSNINWVPTFSVGGVASFSPSLVMSANRRSDPLVVLVGRRCLDQISVTVGGRPVWLGRVQRVTQAISLRLHRPTVRPHLSADPAASDLRVKHFIG